VGGDARELRGDGGHPYRDEPAAAHHLVAARPVAGLLART
jgi:hypothetical protein